MSPLVPMVVEQTFLRRAFVRHLFRLLNERASSSSAQARTRTSRTRWWSSCSTWTLRIPEKDISSTSTRPAVFTRARDLRHDAVHQARRPDDLRRHRDEHGVLFSPVAPRASGCRCQPKILIHQVSPVSGSGHDIEIHANEIIDTRSRSTRSSPSTPARSREDHPRHRARLLHERRRGHHLRPDRPGNRASVEAHPRKEPKSFTGAAIPGGGSGLCRARIRHVGTFTPGGRRGSDSGSGR